MHKPSIAKALNQLLFVEKINIENIPKIRISDTFARSKQTPFRFFGSKRKARHTHHS
jgi:hypothetical protein